jgi:hypothetical protein
MDMKNEVHFLQNVEKTPSFIVYEQKKGYFWGVDIMPNEPLTADDGYPEYKDLNESEQIRAVL